MLKRIGGVTGLFAISFVALGVLFRDWLIVGTLAVVFALVAIGQVVARSRARRRWHRPTFPAATAGGVA